MQGATSLMVQTKSPQHITASNTHRLLPSPRRLGKNPSLSRLCLDTGAVQPSSNLPSASVSLLKAFQLVTPSRLTSHHVLDIPFVGNLSKSEVDSRIVFFLAPFFLFLLCDHLLVDVVQLHHGTFFFDFSELVLQSLDFLLNLDQFSNAGF